MASTGHPLPPPNGAITYRPIAAADLPKAVELEAASYPADEAASEEQLQYRFKEAPELFHGIYEADSLIGFVVSTAAPTQELKEETMSLHSPLGASICLHSVVVAASHQRRGLALAMLKAYVEAVAANERWNCAKCMLLIAKAPLLGLYRKAGFTVLGLSEVVHGADPWFDMKLDLVEARKYEMVQIDAFTNVPLTGNPAAVMFSTKGGDEKWMQGVADENNLAETAFIEERTPLEPGKAAEWSIRWFTPATEVALCGHATLASAHALWKTGRVPSDVTINFQTRKAGVLTCAPLEGDQIKMTFPVQKYEVKDSTRASEFAPLLGISEKDIIAIVHGPATTPDWVVEVNPDAFATLKPDIGGLAAVCLERGLVVTCAGSSHFLSDAAPVDVRTRPRILDSLHNTAVFDFCSRFFAPGVGVAEDPVTGSAHCILAPYWDSKLQPAQGTYMQALQASPRGGVLRVKYDKDLELVELCGEAMTVLSGRMEV
eukprot:CAMPEP_0206506582 /NCGR_PEP_ID=MMETSP0324_2-20121206/56851_1 /ASSEMBLY_ACC=CAM_ASM_000836 /TAXON_ID=2866 /ORGANISM="Crypthecodinium cohnii, Strain Seligo" /LENGTH=487 /DNA_ID=CAMNT_0053996339 /DNA_START=30 /DNA_END=1494 /DNA_ORIENTATION=-